MNFWIAILSLVIMFFFVYNFSEIVKKIKSGASVNKHSLLATSALIFHFLSLTLHFTFDYTTTVLASQLYLLGCLIYLFKKK